ncbi:MAG: ATP-binding cassette domain-containing protein [Rectinema sp.]
MQVELRGITKCFGALRANDNISFTVPPSTIEGILGENGAGKSTLMKILSGFYSPDSGDILLDGEKVKIDTPADAIRQGIGMLHQDPQDFPPLKVIDDFILGKKGGLLPNRKRTAKEFRELSSRFDFSIDPETYVDTLTVGERQQLEILRLLWLGARVLILDEPTTGISLPQKEKLFATLKKLADEGMTILFVSHKLEDVEALCSWATVLRQGKLIGTMELPFATKALVEMMFGKEMPQESKTQLKMGMNVLNAKHIDLDGVRIQIKGVDLQVHAGEVIGLAGMEGSGQTLFLSACAGLSQPVGGSFCLDEEEKAMTGQTYHEFRKKGVAYLPAARLEQALIPGLSLTEHFILSEGMKGLFIDRKKAEDLAKSRIALYNIKGRPDSTVESLSGGNQQRALLALMRDPLKLILVEHPTRGLDVESTIYIWGKLKERCANGTAIVFISSDLDEILKYSDRVLVFFAGRVTPPLNASSLNVERLGRLIGGKDWNMLETEAAHA